MELFKKLVEYTSKDGLEKKVYNIYLQLNNGDLIAIKNAYTKSSKDYYRLLANAKDLKTLEKDLPY